MILSHFFTLYCKRKKEIMAVKTSATGKVHQNTNSALPIFKNKNANGTTKTMSLKKDINKGR